MGGVDTMHGGEGEVFGPPDGWVCEERGEEGGWRLLCCISSILPPLTHTHLTTNTSLRNKYIFVSN